MAASAAGIADEEWEDFFEFTGTKLEQFPLPARLPLERGTRVGLALARSDDSTPQACFGRWMIRRTDDSRSGRLAGAALVGLGRHPCAR